MQRNVLLFALSLALAASSLHSEPVTCMPGELGNVTTPIAYNFENCGKPTQDEEQFAFCPILGAQRQDKSWADIEVEKIWVNAEGGATATVIFTELGKYNLFLFYTPFVYSQKEWEVSSLESSTIVFLKPEIISHLNIQVSGQSKQPPGSLVITFPNLIPSVDPFVVETSEDWKIKVNCLTQNFVWTLIEDPRGCYDRDVSAFVKETTIFLQPCLSSKAPQ